MGRVVDIDQSRGWRNRTGYIDMASKGEEMPIYKMASIQHHDSFSLLKLSV